MRRRRSRVALAVSCGLAAGCGSDPGDPTPPPPPPPAASCTAQSVTQLGVGEHLVIDPAQTDGCVRVPQAGGGGAEYLVVVASTATNRSAAGISGSYQIRASTPATAVSAAPRVDRVDPVERPRRTSAQVRFHDGLRRREVELARDPGARAALRAAPPIAAVPPVVGNVRTFKTCRTTDCDVFDDVVATARYVGTKAAIYMDNSVPNETPLQAEDFEELGKTFDDHHYKIDFEAFGAESDLDNNQRIVILMTDAVNNLTPDCTNGRVLGYFFGLDLITSGSQSINSNKGEIFYTFVPSPATPNCQAIDRETAINNVKPTLIHELQHMISWNQRVILGGGTPEETWLNEAMSHFAEELGGRKIPDAECTRAGYSSCRSQYISSNIFNSYDYAADPESHFLIYPTNSNGDLEERGASWYFLRWALDQFATDKEFGSDLTKAFVTGPGGAATFSSITGEEFARLVPEWLMAVYLDDLPGFTAASPRLRLQSWGLRAIWTNPANEELFPDGFPLTPETTSGGYSRTGTLRGGSGKHLRLVQQANGDAIDVQVTRDASGAPLDGRVAARIGIARIK